VDADGFENAQGAYRVGVGCVFGLFEGDGHVGLGGQVVNLRWLDLLNDSDQA